MAFEKVDFEAAKKRYTGLVEELLEHNKRYYIQANPSISDVEYDALFSDLKEIEELYPSLISPDSPTQTLVNQISEGFNKANHLAPLLSLENSYNAEDLTDRSVSLGRLLTKENITGRSYHVEPKFDGLSVELVYRDGVFVQAITRGDGYRGDDITTNARTITNLPLKLRNGPSGTLSVRAEIMMPKSILLQINNERLAEGLEPFANTRNAAAGSIKLLDSGIVASRQLVCYAYDILFTDQSVSDTQAGILEHLKTRGIPVFGRSQTVDTIEEVIWYCSGETQDYLLAQDIDFDGLVIKVNQHNLRPQIGSTNHHPRRAMAYKFPAQQASTQVIQVDFQVWRTGIITPVAHLTPVQLSGVTISRVSMHNFDIIKLKDIHLHDYIRLQRSGEVIPYIVGVIKERRPNNATQILPPAHCPSCGQDTHCIDDHRYCINPECPAQMVEKIIHFVSKQCMDIEGIGDQIAEILVTQRIIRTVADLYDLTAIHNQTKLLSLPGFAAKRVSEIVTQLEQSKSQPLDHLLNALSIPNIGKKTARVLMDELRTRYPDTQELSLSELNEAFSDTDRLVGIYGLGEKTVEGIVTFLAEEKNQAVIKKLLDAGVGLRLAAIASWPVAGVSMSITGSFPISREEIVALREKNGWSRNDSPTKNTHVMLIGDKPWSKAEKAIAMGIPSYTSREEIVVKFPFLAVVARPVVQQMGLF